MDLRTGGTGQSRSSRGPPEIYLADNAEKERAAAAAFLARMLADGVAPAEIGIFVRSEAELPRALAAAELAGLATRAMAERTRDHAALVGTMHLAEGP